MSTPTTADILRFHPPGREDVGKYVLCWAGLDDKPRIIVNDSLRVLWQNSAARAALAERREIAVTSAALTATDRANAQALADFVHAASAVPSEWCLPRLDGDGHLLLRAVRLEIDGGDTAVGIRFHGTGSDFQPAWTGFRQAFGLTAAEGEVVRALLGGETAGDIAARLTISLGTVRTHIRNAYAKLDVNSREHLFRRLSPFRADMA